MPFDGDVPLHCKTLLAAVSLVAISASYAAARPTIEVVGNANVDTEFVTSSFPDKAKYSSEDIDATVKTLYATGAFSDVKIASKGGKIVVTVAETPVVVNVSFVGNERLKDDQLSAKAGLDSGTAFDPSRLPDVVSRIEQAYASTGRRAAKVSSAVTQRGQGFYDVAFTIEEGERSSTSSIWFDGNTSFSALKLRSVMTTKETWLLSRVFAKDVIDTERLEIDRQRIEAFYRSKGFADVVVSTAEVDFDAEGKNGMAGFRIKEGPRYTVGAVTYENGTGKALPPEVERVITSEKGRVYDGQSISKNADDLARRVEDFGGSPVDVHVRTSRQPNGTMDVSYLVDHRSRVYVERIEIAGNHVTKDYVIRREFDLSEGDVFNARLVREAERRLNRLGFFDSVHIQTSKGSSDDRIVINVDVVERKTGEFTIGGAVSTSDGPMAIVSLSQANFGGTGRAVSASIGQGTDTSNYDFSFTEPYIFGTRLSATAQVFRRDYDERDGGFRPYDETVSGGKFTIKGPLSADSDLSVYYSITNSSKDDIDHRFADLVSADDRVVSSIGYDWSFSDLDDEKDPSNGYRIGFGQQFAGVGGDATFLKTEASARAYRELSQRHEIVGSVSVKAGHVAGIGEDLSFEDHFRSMPDLVRGFETGGFGPRDAGTGYLLGGQYYAGASAEAIYPIPVLSDGLGIKGSIFADMGTIWGADSGRAKSSGATLAFDDASIRASFGTGIVWDSPLGLFKANFAVPLSKEDGDRTQVFSISGGTRF